MKILYLKWQGYMMSGVERALKKLFSDVVVLTYTIVDFEQDEILESQMKGAVADQRVDTVFSINFLPVLSQICERLGVVYYSWGYAEACIAFHSDRNSIACDGYFGKWWIPNVNTAGRAFGEFCDR